MGAGDLADERVDSPAAADPDVASTVVEHPDDLDDVGGFEHDGDGTRRCTAGASTLAILKMKTIFVKVSPAKGRSRAPPFMSSRVVA
ncbi:hypothetical protein GCM10023193_60950 [Planotetraspora kaengkrachanensis]|uniref:Uncharacterized protein n=1 Tax=Planotetraspora kaengkrachanensis TaxID=575193 RepID=A0A8J3PX77_9ACTN|nr:hypothetical protein Pka01_56630 [Planotetraspora kaengkrachanensis]